MASFDTFSMENGSYDNSFSYSSFTAVEPPPYQPDASGFNSGEFDDVTPDQSPGPFGFESDPLETTPFGSSVPVSNGNGKPFDLDVDSDGIFSSDGQVRKDEERQGGNQSNNTNYYYNYVN